MNKIISTIVVIVIVVLGGYFLIKETNRPKVSPESVQEPTSQSTKEQTPIVEEKVIIYTDTGYSPNTLTIKNGETVVFKNQSSKTMWPASAMHPSHRVYGGTSFEEHCPDTTGVAFDACKGFLPSGIWSFKFDKVGDWKYHDHLNSGDFGTIVVIP